MLFQCINIAQALQGSVGLYDVFEIQLINNRIYSNPFDYTVIELQATFTSPSGKNINFFGFYDGDGKGGQNGNIWKLRFMPDEAGIWNYTYIWTDGIKGGSGTFNVIDTGIPGPLKVATDNSWYFMDSRGNPFHARAYDMPSNPSNMPNPELYNNLVELNKQYIDTYVIPKGYNLVMITAPGLYYPLNMVQGHTWWYYNEGYNFDRYDINSWTNYDKIINHYKLNNIYVFPFSIITQSQVATIFNIPARMNKFQRYYVARTGAHWNLFGNSFTWEWSEQWTESTINNWMINPHLWNPFKTLLTIHDSMRESFTLWGGFSMRQVPTRNVITGNNRTLGNIQGSFINKPILGSEDIWESGLKNHPRNGIEVRRGAWGDMLAGIIPIYSEWEEPCSLLGCGNGEGEEEVLRMFTFFYSKTNYRQYEQLNNLVPGSARQIVSGIQGQEYLVYDENGGSINIDLSGTSPSDTFSVLWFDPETGIEESSGNVNGGASIMLNSPLSGDSVLLLSKGIPIVYSTAYPNSGKAPLTVNFTGYGIDLDGNISSYRWTFGDGSTSNSINATHTFTMAGNYHVILTITDNAGNIGNKSAKIIVSPMDSTLSGAGNISISDPNMILRYFLNIWKNLLRQVFSTLPEK